MSDVLNLLLSADTQKVVERPTRKIEIKRLSAIAGAPVIFTIQGLTADEYGDIQQKSIGKHGDMDSSEIQILSVLHGVKDPSLKDKKLKEAYHVPNSRELVGKILAPGEILNIYNIVSDLSGFGDEAVEEIKNA